MTDIHEENRTADVAFQDWLSAAATSVAQGTAGMIRRASKASSRWLTAPKEEHRPLITLVGGSMDASTDLLIRSMLR